MYTAEKALLSACKQVTLHHAGKRHSLAITCFCPGESFVKPPAILTHVTPGVLTQYYLQQHDRYGLCSTALLDCSQLGRDIRFDEGALPGRTTVYATRPSRRRFSPLNLASMRPHRILFRMILMGCNLCMPGRGYMPSSSV